MDKQQALSDYEARKAAKIERLRERAEKKRAEGQSILQDARQMADVIPFGQPILVGHYSEKSDRRYRERIHNKYGKGFEALDAAKELEERAETAENNTAIYTDDPTALDQLRVKLRVLQDEQERMRQVNKLHRAYLKTGKLPEGLSQTTIDLIVNYKPAYSWEPNPYPPYRLSNNNANIKRVQDRIKQLEKREQKESREWQVGEVKIVDNVEANRLQIFFPGKPDEATRTTLKRYGFRWTPSLGCWQAYRNNSSRWGLEQLGLKG